MARNEHVLQNGLKLGNKTIDFKGQSSVHVDDDIVSEVEKEYGLKGSGDVWTHEDPILNHTERYKADGIHSYIWGASPRYSKAWDAFEKRRSDKKKEG